MDRGTLLNQPVKYIYFLGRLRDIDEAKVNLNVRVIGDYNDNLSFVSLDIFL